MTKPLVSIIIPVYNGEAYLAEAVKSVLAQKYRPIEIIIIDDGSTDGSALITKGFGSTVRYFFQSNSGTGVARNKGIHLASGNFLAFLDQDDLWTKDKLANQMTILRRDTEVDAVFGHIEQFCSSKPVNSSMGNIQYPVKLRPGYSPSTLLIKRTAFFRVGLFGTSWQVGEWVDWYVRLVESGLKTITLPHLVARRRIHNGNKGLIYKSKITEYAQILKASLDRRRARDKVVGCR